jgi:hypothetical protein
MTDDREREPAMQPDDAMTVALNVSDLTVSLNAPGLTADVSDLQRTQRLPVRRPPEPKVADTQRLDQQRPDQTMLYTDDGHAHAPTVVGGALAPTVNLAEVRGTDEIAPLGPGEYRHFGPGIPAPPTNRVPSQAAAVWHGEPPTAAEPRRRRALLGGWLLPILVLIVVLAVLYWFRMGTPVSVTGATARAQPSAVSCGDTATVIGTMQTNGGSGTVSYQWKRSDGTESAVLQQHFAKGTHQTSVTLLWTFSGRGSVQATATLDVLTPNVASASTTFSYACK